MGAPRHNRRELARISDRHCIRPELSHYRFRFVLGNLNVAALRHALGHYIRDFGVRNDLVNTHVGHSIRRSPDLVRRICFKDRETGKTLVFITNQRTLPPPR